MPNWSEGSIKLKGKYSDILRFIKDGLKASDEHTNWLAITEHEDGCFICFNGFTEPFDWIYISDTTRAFIIPNPSIIWLNKSDETVVAFHFAQAWGICYEDWLSLAKKYDLSFRFFTVDQLLGTWGDEIIRQDGTIEDRSGDGSEFLWNCPIPWLGG